MKILALSGRLRQASIELAIPAHVRSQAHGEAVHHHLADAAQRVALALGGINQGDHLRLGGGVERAQRGGIGGGVQLGRHFVGAPRLYAAEVHQVRAHGDAALGEQQAADGASGHPGGRLAG